jgi:hypothetical protein
MLWSNVLLLQEFFQMSPPHLSSSALLTTASLIQLGALHGVECWSKDWHISCSHFSHDTRASITVSNIDCLHIIN